MRRVFEVGIGDEIYLVIAHDIEKAIEGWRVISGKVHPEVAKEISNRYLGVAIPCGPVPT